MAVTKIDWTVGTKYLSVANMDQMEQNTFEHLHNGIDGGNYWLNYTAQSADNIASITNSQLTVATIDLSPATNIMAMVYATYNITPNLSTAQLCTFALRVNGGANLFVQKVSMSATANFRTPVAIVGVVTLSAGNDQTIELTAQSDNAAGGSIYDINMFYTVVKTY